MDVTKEKLAEETFKPEGELNEKARETGVEGVGERPTLTEKHAKIGVQPKGESIPVGTKDSAVTRFPRIDEVKKNLMQPFSNSGRWLAELGRKILKRFGLWKEGK